MSTETRRWIRARDVSSNRRHARFGRLGDELADSVCICELQDLYTSARSAGNMSTDSTTTPETAPVLHVSTAPGHRQRKQTARPSFISDNITWV